MEPQPPAPKQESQVAQLPYKVSRDEVLMGRDKEFPLTPELEANLAKLLPAINKFRDIYGKPLKVSSGYRPGAFNQAAGGAKKSNHMLCLAVDFQDVDGSLKLYCSNNLKVLEECGLYLEDPASTPTWVHLQCVPPRSGNRVFKP